MVNSIYALSSILLAFLFLCLRQVLLKIARYVAECDAILRRSSNVLREDQLTLPKRIKYGKKIPVFSVVDTQNLDSISPRNWIGKSSIIVFFQKQEFERWQLDHLNMVFRSWWYHIDGSLYIILMDEGPRATAQIPQAKIFDTDIGQHIVIGFAVERDIKRALGLTKTPIAVELDANGNVRRIGFFGDQQPI